MCFTFCSKQQLAAVSVKSRDKKMTPGPEARLSIGNQKARACALFLCHPFSVPDLDEWFDIIIV